MLATQYTVKDERIPVEGGDILVRCLIPQGGDNETYPVLMWLHGGGASTFKRPVSVPELMSLLSLTGWMTGGIDADDYQLRAICVELQLTIVNVEYRYDMIQMVEIVRA